MNSCLFALEYLGIQSWNGVERIGVGKRATAARGKEKESGKRGHRQEKKISHSLAIKVKKCGYCRKRKKGTRKHAMPVSGQEEPGSAGSEMDVECSRTKPEQKKTPPPPTAYLLFVSGHCFI